MESTQKSLRVRDPMDSFTTLQARNSTLNFKWKKEERKEACRTIDKFFYSARLTFNVVNDKYYVPMHELRTSILKDEVASINKMLEEHKKVWSKYGCSIMSYS